MRGRWWTAALMLALSLLAGCTASPAPKAKASPSASSGVAAAQTPSTAPAVVGVATLSEGYCRCATLHLISLGGDQIGSVTFDRGVLPPISSGANGIYYVLGDQLMRLGENGTPGLVGTVAEPPSAPGASVGSPPVQGALAMAPGSTEWGYLQSVSAGPTQTKQLWLGEANRAPRLLLSSEESPTSPSSEFPDGWNYQLLGWSNGSLVLAQVPSGSSSFASAALEVSLVNPQTGVQTLLANSQNCPISAVAGNGEYACFQQGGGQATELVTGVAGITTGTWALPPGTGYGGALFEPSGAQLLFSECAGCGSAPGPAYLGSQMELLDSATGSTQPVGPVGLLADAWLADGMIVATEYSQLDYAPLSATPLSEVVLFDPASDQLATLTDNATSQFVGLATA